MKNLSFNKGRPSCLCIIIFAILLSNHMYAIELTFGSYTKQLQHQITGTVTDATGPLPSVTVIVKGTTTSAVTNEKGNFSITANSTDVLVFSFIGYATQEITVGSQTSIKVILSEDNTQLKEVTINAGYYKVKDKERTGSIARITSKDIEKQPVSNVLATMQGRMAGVDIIQDGGTPGGGFQIKIRGLNSLRENGNEPLYIIDGVPYSSETIGFATINSGTASMTSPLNSINPSDIESIEVLKDADATAIYGSRGANGVVLISTKKGKTGKTKVSVNASTGIGKVTKMPKLMNTQQYLEMRRQGFENDGITTYPDTAYDINGTWDQGRYTDWQKVLMGGTTEIYNVQTSISGGSEQTQFLLSGTYRTETTVLPGDFRYDKGGVHFSMNHMSDDKKFKLVFSGGYTSQNNVLAATDITRTSRNLAPNAPALYDEYGNLNFENGTFKNPLAEMRSVSTIKTNDLVANSVLSYQIGHGFELKANLGYTDLKNNEQRTLPSTMFDPAYNLGSEYSTLYTNMTQRQSWIAEPQLHYSHAFNTSTLDVLVGATMQQQKSGQLYELGYGFASNSLITDIASASQKFILGSGEAIYKYQAYFGRLNYNFKDRYILNLTGRRDGSSRFGPGKQFAIFGAVGAAWLFSNENFIKDNSILSFGKLRMSYGSSGNDQIGDYQYLNTYASSGLNYQGVIGFNPTRLYNPDFGWEVNRKFEAAIETGFLKDRISTTVAYYKNRSSNQLVGIPLPGTTGFSSINANLDATVQNSGYEFTLHTVNVDTKDFNWTTNFNISASRNKLIAFQGLEGSTYSNRYVVGESTSIVKVFHYTGVNPQTGLYEVQDVNGDGIITALNDKKTIADLTPDYFGGLQNQFRYKNLQLDFLFQFVNQQVYDYNPGVPGGNMSNQRADMMNSWQHTGDISTYQINTSGANSSAVTAYYNYLDSDASIVDGSYVRLKNVSLSYDIPLQRSNNIACKIYLQGQNVLTFTNYKGGDPEFRFAGYLPPLKVYTAGVQLTF